MFDINSLNPEQQQAVRKINGSLLLIAGAGTGKTRVITYRIANMIASGVDPASIAAMTFTNKAAREMQERLTEIVGQAAAKKIFIGTIHRFCLQILRRYHKEADLHRNFRIIATGDQLDLVRRSLEEKGWSGQYRPDYLHAAISYAKNQLWSLEDIESQSQVGTCPYDPTLVAQTFALYERQLKLNHVIDFDDCMAKVALLLKANSDVAHALATQYGYVMVDEFQDTNMAQLAVIHELAKSHGNICVVGDDDQSIYSWRGAVTEIFELFEAYFPERTMIKLEQNYRCADSILDAANKVIVNNAARKEKTLWCRKEAKHKVTLAKLADEGDEAQWIAEKCLAALGRGVKARDIGILYRTNGQARALEIACREARLPYKVFGGQSIFEKKEVKDVLAYLRVMANPNDRLAFLRVINTPTRGFGLKTLESLEKRAKESKASLFSILQGHPDALPTRIQRTAGNFVASILDLSQKKLRTPEDARDLVKEIIRVFRLETDIRMRHKEKSLADKKLQVLRSIPDWFAEMAKRQLQIAGNLELKELLDQLTLDNNDKVEDEESQNYISLMTIHAAKGLEFPYVFLAGLEEGILPHQNSVEHERDVAEERRLFYVAITRAKEKLHLSRALERTQGPSRQPMDPSRFIEELPIEHISTDLDESENKPIKQDKKKRTLRKLQNLRSELRNTDP